MGRLLFDLAPQGEARNKGPGKRNSRVGAAVDAHDKLVKDIEALIAVMKQRTPESGAFTHAVSSAPVQAALREVVDQSLKAANALQIANALLRGQSALVVRGGVSMGAYQAGVVYVLTALFRRAGNRWKSRGRGFDVAVGTSAGAVNAAFAAKASCEKKERKPQDSDFFKTWRQLGLRGVSGGLFERSQVGARSILSKAVISDEVERLQKALLEETYHSDCESTVGLTTTRLEPKNFVFETQSGRTLNLPIQEERFAFKITGKEACPAGEDCACKSTGGACIFEAQPPLETSFNEKQTAVLERLHQQLYPSLDKNNGRAELIELMCRLVVASGTFPIAFAPEAFGVNPDGEFTFADARKTEKIELIDGGVFDSQPVGYAVELARARATKGWEPQTCPNELEGLLPQSQPTEFFLVEPSVLTYGHESDDSPAERCNGKGAEACLLGTYMPFVGGFLNTARATKLVQTIEQFPFLAIDREGFFGDAFTIIPRSHPVASEHLGHFFGFFEEDFRKFDFYVGLVDGVDELANRGIWSRSSELVQVRDELETDPLYKCASDYFHEKRKDPPCDRNTKKTGSCPSLDELWDFQSCVDVRAVFRGTSNDEFHKEATETDQEFSGRLARAVIASVKRDAGGSASQGTLKLRDRLFHMNFARLLIVSENMRSDAEQEHSDLGELQRFIGYLEDTGFRYVDLQLMARERLGRYSKVNTAGVIALVRELIAESVTNLAKQQDPVAQKALVSLVGKSAINMMPGLGYHHPRRVLQLSIAQLGLDLQYWGNIPSTRRFKNATFLAWGVRGYRLGRVDVFDPGTLPAETERFFKIDFGTYARIGVGGPCFFGSCATSIRDRRKLTKDEIVKKKARTKGLVQTRIGFGYLVEGMVAGTLKRGATFLRHGPEAAFSVTLFQRLGLDFYGIRYLDGCGPGPFDRCIQSGVTTRRRMRLPAWGGGVNLTWSWLFEPH